MRTILYLLILIISSNYLSAQQDEYTAYLEQAYKAMKKKDQKGFNTNLKYFSTAMGRDNISPKDLSNENIDSYTNLIYVAIADNFIISNELGKQAIEFLQYDIENRPNNYFSIAYLYENGLGVNKDREKAIYWYEKAINIANSTNAMHNLGLIYFDKSDYAQGLYWIEKAAENGNAGGFFTLGLMYHQGIHFEKNYTKAFQNYTEAAEKGSVNAMLNLAILYKDGDGFKYLIDYDKAIDWFSQAALKGNADAMNHLGDIYINGLGVEVDNDKAKKLFRLACDYGNQNGCENAETFN